MRSARGVVRRFLAPGALAMAVLLGSAGPAFAASPPVNTVLPKISGTGRVYSSLTAAKGTWSNSPTAYAYSWQRCNTSGASCVAISSATSVSYTLQVADQSATIRVAVTATNSAGSVTATPVQTSVIATPPAPTNSVLPTIIGVAQVGQTLTSTTGTWTYSPTSYAYVWKSCNG